MPEEINIPEGNNLSLVGFKKLDKTEIDKVKEILLPYIKKLEEKTDYDLLKIELRIHPRSHTFIHELESDLLLRPGKILSAKSVDKNLYKAIPLLMKKLISEVEHIKKKTIRERPIRKKII